jgi:hypothetical protein
VICGPGGARQLILTCIPDVRFSNLGQNNIPTAEHRTFPKSLQVITEVDPALKDALCHFHFTDSLYQGWPTRPATEAALQETSFAKSHVLNAKIRRIKLPLGFD